MTSADAESSVHRPIQRPLDSIKLLIVHPHGRAGSVFLQSLFDGHPEVVTLPHFGPIYEVLPLTIEDVDGCLDEFVRRRPHLFDSSLGYFGQGTATVSGAFGPAADQHLVVSSDQFRGIFREILRRHCPEKARPISRANFFRLVHLAYGETVRKVPLAGIKYILYHPHKYGEFEALAAEFPDLAYIAMTRDPRQDWESWRKVIAGRVHSKIDSLSFIFLLKTIAMYSSDVANLVRLCQQLGPGRFKIIDLDRLHLLNKSAMESLCLWLSLQYDTCLLQSTFNGQLWAGNAASRTRMSSFEPDRKSQVWRTELPPDEIQLISSVLSPSIAWLGYEKIVAARPGGMRSYFDSGVKFTVLVRFLAQSLREKAAAPAPSLDSSPLRRFRALYRKTREMAGFVRAELRCFMDGGYRRAWSKLDVEQNVIAGVPAPREAFL